MADPKPVADLIRETAARIGAGLSHPDYIVNAARQAAEQAEFDRRQRWYARKACGIPERFLDVVEAPRETAVLAATRAFLARFDGGATRLPPSALVLVLCGPVGTGKSISAAWAVSQHGGRYAEAADLIQASLWSDRTLDEFQRTRLLALDELGMEPLDPAGWGESKFYDVMNARLQNARPTVIATNLDPLGFLTRYADERMRDRLRAAADVFVGAGPSMRER